MSHNHNESNCCHFKVCLWLIATPCIVLALCLEAIIAEVIDGLQLFISIVCYAKMTWVKFMQNKYTHIHTLKNCIVVANMPNMKCQCAQLKIDEVEVGCLYNIYNMPHGD